MARTLSFDVVRRFRGGPEIRARADLDLGDAPVTVLFGPSGAGKTTVLRALAGLDRPDSGHVRFAGETWFDAGAGVFVPPQRRGIGLLFQDYALFPHLTVARNVGFGVPRAARAGRVGEVAALLGIADLLHRRPSSLSGGQRQRVALARALAPRPRLLLLDEPLSALDAPAREALRGELRRTLEEAGVPAIVVTHDRVEALALGDRLVVLAGGAVRQVGPVQEVFGAPADVEVARVVGTENVYPAHVVRREAGLATVALGPFELVAIDPAGEAGEVFACVRAEEVVIVEEGHARDTSARNALPGRVVSRVDEGPMIRVALDCSGVRVVVLVTRQSADRLGLVPGASAVALVKTPAVQLVPRGR